MPSQILCIARLCWAGADSTYNFVKDKQVVIVVCTLYVMCITKVSLLECMIYLVELYT